MRRSAAVVVTSMLFLAWAGAAQAAETCSTLTPLLLDPEVVPLSECTATASCGVHPDVHCEGDSNCIAVDRNCVYGGPLETGYVKCDGVTTGCPQDSGCVLQCHQEFEACSANCTTFIPCVQNCIDARNYCRCNC